MIGRHSYVEPIVFFTRACTYTYFTIESQFVYQFVSESHNFTRHESVSYCAENQTTTPISFSDQSLIVAEEVSRWTKIANIVKGIANTISVLVITSWSDEIGRRNALLCPVIGALVCSLLLAINIYWRLSLIIYVAESFIYGITGGWVTLINVGTAYLSDTVGKSQRGHRYTILEMCALLGGGLTQIGMGYLLTVYGFLPPTIFITCCAVIALLLTILLKESRMKAKGEDSSGSCDELGLKEHPSVAKVNKAEKRQRTKKSETGLVTILIQLREVFRIYTSNSAQCGSCDKEGIDCTHCDASKKRVWRLWLFLSAYVVYMIAIDAIDIFITMFLVSFPICFTPAQVGIQTGLEYSISILAPLLIFVFRSVLKFGNQTVILCAILGRIVSSAIMFFAVSAAGIYIGTAVDLFGILTAPFIRVQISNLLSPAEQGPGLALVPSIAKLINIPAQAIILTIYPATLYIGHSFIWVVMGALFIMAFILMAIVWLVDKVTKESRAEEKYSTDDEI